MNESLFYTYGGVSRHEFLIETVNSLVNSLDWTKEGIDKEDAWNEIYVNLIEFLNSETTLHDRDGQPHFGAKKIVYARGKAIRGQLVASQKTDAHEEVTNKRVKDLLIHAMTSESFSAEDELVEQAFLELDSGYREVLSAVVLDGKENSWPRHKLSRALTSLSNKIDLKFSKHTESLYVTDHEGNETLIEPSDPTELTIDEIIEQYDHDEVHLNYSEATYHDALEDLLGREFPGGFEDAVTETISTGYGIDFHLYTLCNNQGTSDPNLMRAWNHLDNDEKELLLIRYNRGYDSRFKRRYHEESVAVRDKLEKIWLNLDTYVPDELLASAVELVQEMTVEAPETVVEALEPSEPTPVPLSVQEVLPIVSSGLDSLEAFLEDGFVEDERFYTAWNQMDELDRFYLQLSTDPGVPELTKRRGRPKIEAATDKYMKMYKEIS